MAKILSISVTAEEKQWLEDMNLSPTALIKQKIGEMQTASRAQRQRIVELERELEQTQEVSMKRLKFIIDKGLSEEYNGLN